MSRSRACLVLGWMVLGACRPAVVEIPLDPDQDGLLDDLEAEMGTDPENPDTDGDGHLDGAEVEQGTDPLDAQDHPYAGGWEIADCNDEIVPTGEDVGQVTGDFERMDQFGETLRLYDFCDRVILMVSSAFW